MLLFIVFFQGIISWKGVSCFRWGGGSLFFRWGASFLSGGGGAPWEGISCNEGVFKKKFRMGGGGTPYAPPLWETL